MEEIQNRVIAAKSSRTESENLLTDYLPFIKKQISAFSNTSLEYSDMLSIAMLTFINCIQQYVSDKGSFLEFTSLCIKNRIIDELRKQKKYSDKVILWHSANEDNKNGDWENNASYAQYNKEKERQNLIVEIDILSAALSKFGITFQELTKICPKQQRSRNLCMFLAKEMTENKVYLKKFETQQRLPQAELSKMYNISKKTIEKYRKYIVALIIILLGDYSAIKAFLPYCKEED